MMNQLDRDRLLQQLGECDQLIRQLESQVAQQQQQWQADAHEWQVLLRHRKDLAEWLVDAATNEHGRLIKSRIDAALGGEDFVPCTFATIVNGKRYRFSLFSTAYEVEEA